MECVNNPWLCVATRWQYKAVAACPSCCLSLQSFILWAKTLKPTNNKKQFINNIINEMSSSYRTSSSRKLFPLFFKFHYFLFMHLSTLMTWALLFALNYISRIFPCALSIDVSCKLCKPFSHWRSASVVEQGCSLFFPSMGNSRGQ